MPGPVYVLILFKKPIDDPCKDGTRLSVKHENNGKKERMLANVSVNDLQTKIAQRLATDPRYKALLMQAPATAVSSGPYTLDVEIPDDYDLEDGYYGYFSLNSQTYEVPFDIQGGEPILTDGAWATVDRVTRYLPSANEATPQKSPQDTENDLQDAAIAKKAADTAKEATGTANDATQVAGEANTQEAHGVAAKAHQVASKANAGAAKAYGDTNKFMQQTFQDRADSHDEQADAHQKEADLSDRSSKNLSSDAKQASAKAMAATKYAQAGDAPEPHGIASQEHDAAAAAHTDAETALRPSDPIAANFHQGQAETHKADAKFHAEKAGVEPDDAKGNEAFWTCLRARLGDSKAAAVAVDFAEPDAAIDIFIANQGGQEAATKMLFANDERTVKLGDKDMGPQFIAVQKSDSNPASNAVAASNTAFAASAKIRALGKNANAQDWATLADAHLQAAQAYSGWQWDSPELMDSVKAMQQYHEACGRDAQTAEQAAVDQMTNRKADFDRYNAWTKQAQDAIAMSSQVAGVTDHRDNVAKQMADYMPDAAALSAKERNDAASLILKLRSGNGKPLQGVASLVGGAAANEGNSEGASKGWETRRSGASSTASDASQKAAQATQKALGSDSPEDHQAAATLHQTAQDFHEKAAKLETNAEPYRAKGFHESVAKAHEATVQYHQQKSASGASAAAEKASNDVNPEVPATHATAALAHYKASEAHKAAGNMGASESHRAKADSHDTWARNGKVVKPETAPVAKAATPSPEARPNEALTANEKQYLVNEWDGPFVMEKANEADSGTNWVMISPYGDWPHTGGMQRFQKSDANEIIADFNSPVGLLKRTLGMGIPFYKGHPDHPDFKARYTDTAAYGRIKKMEARDDGLWGNVKWSTAGKQMVNEEQFHGHSVNWRVRKDAQGNWRPFSIKSVGFTNEPNIAVPPITQANEQDPDIENDLIAA